MPPALYKLERARGFRGREEIYFRDFSVIDGYTPARSRANEQFRMRAVYIYGSYIFPRAIGLINGEFFADTERERERELGVCDDGVVRVEESGASGVKMIRCCGYGKLWSVKL